jgi:hypothetical protein
MLLSTPHAYNDGLGPGPDGVWKGTVEYDRVFGTNNVDSTVEFAVFGPGKFQFFLNDNWGVPPVDPAPGDVIYAYQIINVNSAVPGIQLMSVGLDSIDDPHIVSPPSYVLTGLAGEQAPGPASAFNDTSMVWSFANNSGTPEDERINTGQFSPILIFSSRWGPELDKLTVASGGAANPSILDGVPSIGNYIAVPEPLSQTLLLVGSASLLGLLRRRSGR